MVILFPGIGEIVGDHKEERLDIADGQNGKMYIPVEENGVVPRYRRFGTLSARRLWSWLRAVVSLLGMSTSEIIGFPRFLGSAEFYNS